MHQKYPFNSAGLVISCCVQYGRLRPRSNDVGVDDAPKTSVKSIRLILSVESICNILLFAVRAASSTQQRCGSG